LVTQKLKRVWEDCFISVSGKDRGSILPGDHAGKAFWYFIRESLNKLNQTELTMAFKDIMQSIYAHEKNNWVDLKLFASQFISELDKSNHRTKLGHLSVDLKLN
jgi:hypothetical protein